MVATLWVRESVPHGVAHLLCDSGTFNILPGLSFPICRTEADASRALPSSAPLVSSCKWESEFFPRGLLVAPAFRLPPSGSRGSALSSEHPGPPPAPSWRRPAPLRPPERIPGPKAWEELSSWPWEGPWGPGLSAGQESACSVALTHPHRATLTRAHALHTQRTRNAHRAEVMHTDHLHSHDACTHTHAHAYITRAHTSARRRTLL